MNNELNKKLIDYGIRSFVRGVILTTLLETSKKTKKSLDIIKLINKNILEQFTIIAKDESKKVLLEIKGKL